MNKSFAFSIVMSVYNVEEYINEAVDSIINQTMDFCKNVQIVFVDDGSIDKSGIICEQYKEKYPNNIIVIHKENEGQAKARLVGIKYATGEYVNFLDPDDVLSAETIENVFCFFENNKTEVDIVSIPIRFFGDLSGEHPLNNKFEHGTRVINLLDEWKVSQMSLAASFIKRDALDDFDADTEIVTAEDAIELTKILIKKKKMGVVKEAQYNYRKRSSSTVGQAQEKQGWYETYLSHYSEWALKYCLNLLGEIPKFIQYTVLYDLQWKLRPSTIRDGVLTPELVSIYQKHLFSLARYFDIDVILAQKFIYMEHKLFLLYKKFGAAPMIKVDAKNKEVTLTYHGVVCYKPSSFLVTIQHINILDDKIYIEYTQTIPNIDLPAPKFFIDASGELIRTKVQSYDNSIYSAGVKVGERITCRTYIPFSKNKKYCKISFITMYGNIKVNQKQLKYNKYSPLNPVFEDAHYHKRGVTIRAWRYGFIARRIPKKQALQEEIRYCYWLFQQKDPEAKRAAFDRIKAFVGRKMKRKQIWLVCDKSDRADDNGEAFFMFLQKLKSKNIDSYFLIGKDSPDYKRLKKIGKVVPYMSQEHKSLYLKADYIISAYSHDEINNPFLTNAKYYSDLLQDCQFIFLQHGIIKDDLSTGLNRFHKNIRLFVCSTDAERRSVVDNPKYGYSEHEVILTGLPRYDRLYHAEKNEIVIMPTWRRNLFGAYHPETTRWDLKPGFEESDYFLFYNSLLNDERLLAKINEKGYKINFVPHPVLFPYIDYFHVPREVKVWGENVTYRDMFAINKLLVTDFSSVAFDFAYLRKPVIYAHFDTNHYEEGYFNYERDGFGEVEYDLEQTINRIINYIEHGCLLKEMYRNRIDSFFTFDDKNNCQRVFNEIINLK